ncbi:S-adenosyl-L-methionine-dependent methyltransferase [Nemania abortiva]|nr:S-adenosyl-L-methionine-dependent methyltransferase [Nemania abortiva]
MPRLAPSLFRRAGRISPHLATLLPACRTIESAQAELRWIRAHALSASQSRAEGSGSGSGPGSDGRGRGRGKTQMEARVARLVERRGTGEPLQYVLGSQPFADLDVRCKKGVLIPRPETEAWASTLADLVFSSSGYWRKGEGGNEGREGEGQELRILDLCSGTGCIGLSLYARGTALRQRGDNTPLGLRLFGFDLEPRAVRLARRNLLRNFRDSSTHNAVAFQKADIFTDEWMARLEDVESSSRKNEDESKEVRLRRIDLLVSNPPYISQRGFATDTGRSVRNYEPKLALVPPSPISTATPSASTPCAPEDVFYARLLDIAAVLRPRIAVFEVGDMRQAVRVAEMAIARSPGEGQAVDKSGDGNGDGDGDEPNESRGPRWDVVEIWRDWPDWRPEDAEEDLVLVGGREVPVRGSGHGRVVFLVEGAMMRNRYTNRGFRREVYVG